ncbi:MAG: hypothetical protein Q7U66_17160 [Methylobacter sp.]|nr:hypothetical protein [Methylobacter sp.]
MLSLIQHQSDISWLQEIKIRAFEFPYASFEEIGSHAICTGQKIYNSAAFIGKLLAECKSCRIDKSPRALERPSGHAPVLVEF